jgi:hypothetical protein
MEARGDGLADLIRRAINANLPVLIAVPEHRFAALIKFAGGMNVRLPCQRKVLDRWWRSVGGEPSRQQEKVRPTFCDVWN